MNKRSATARYGRAISDSELARISAGKLDYSGYTDKELQDFAKLLQDQANDALEHPKDYADYGLTVRISMEMLDTVKAELDKRAKRSHS